MTAFDTWLGRFTSFSQIFLVIIAAATVWLTVIPLYQKELTAEELAKAQLKLNSVQLQIDDLNKSVVLKETKLAEVTARLEQITQVEETGRKSLNALNADLATKTKELSTLKALNKQIADGSSKLKRLVVSESQLKFRQSLEWFTLYTGLQRDCYHPEASEIFADPEARKAETAKGCSPYAFIKNGLEVVATARHDAAGDRIAIPEVVLKKWISSATATLEMKKNSLRSKFDLSVYKSMDPDNITRKNGESDAAFYKRVHEMENTRDEYAKVANEQDREVEDEFIRSLELPM